MKNIIIPAEDFRRMTADKKRMEEEITYYKKQSKKRKKKIKELKKKNEYYQDLVESLRQTIRRMTRTSGIKPLDDYTKTPLDEFQERMIKY